jgi:ferredoxin-NADP reductase
VKTIRFAVSNWPGHLSGQHADVRLTAEHGYRAERSYSIASPPDVSPLELTVERLDDGEVSPFLTGVLQLDDTIELRGPIGGHFVWSASPGAQPLLLLAGRGLRLWLRRIRGSRVRPAAAGWTASHSDSHRAVRANRNVAQRHAGSARQGVHASRSIVSGAPT